MSSIGGTENRSRLPIIAVGGEAGPSVGVRSGVSRPPRGESAAGCSGITSTSRAEVRTKVLSQA